MHGHICIYAAQKKVRFSSFVTLNGFCISQASFIFDYLDLSTKLLRDFHLKPMSENLIYE